jgi:trigger factor
MAQVQEVSKDGLKREFTITEPKATIESALGSKLAEIAKTVKMPGFRPGKVPLSVVQQRYASSARAEVVDQMVSDLTEKTLSDRKLRPAGQPNIELVTFGEGKDLEFKLAVEIMPDVTPGDFSKIAVERPVAEADEKTVVDAITRAAKGMREPEVITEKRAAKMGDVLVIDFDGTVDGKAQPGMKSQDHHLELGTKSFIDTFEEQLVGLNVGDKKTIKVTFPADYHAANLSGKQAEFVVKVKEIRAHKALEMNDELAKELGFPSMEKLRERVKNDIDADYNRISRAIAKRLLMDKLADMHSFEVPQGMLEREFQSIWQQVDAARQKGELPDEDKNKSDDVLKKEYHTIAERRIRLGLLLTEIAEKQKITVLPDELRGALIAESRRFPGQEKAVFDYYTQTQGAMERLRAPLLEEKVVDYILGQAKVTDKKMSAEELTKLPAEMD